MLLQELISFNDFDEASYVSETTREGYRKGDGSFSSRRG